MTIIEGRHPVIEEFLPRGQQFIPNTLMMIPEDTEIGFLHIIT
jgi:DNA mismatch repair ATPase MutS